jgi:endo-1,4-beta-xylanase
MMSTRRAMLAASATSLLAACGPALSRTGSAGVAAPSLKALAPFPIGTCVQDLQLIDSDWTTLARRHFSQLTPEWEMKMEYVVLPDGNLRFDRGDHIADFARENRMRLHGTSLIWYAQKPEGFLNLDTNRVSFASAYDRFITMMMQRYANVASGWDVVNEPIAEEGNGWRDSLWAQKLGAFDHMVRAFNVAAEADPRPVRFINDYNLESKPAKLDSYLKLIEKLLSARVPLSGIGCQTHVSYDLPEGAITRTITALAQFGLPIHISEIDVSIGKAFGPQVPERWQAQARLYAEALDAFAALPPEQRYAFTIWGLRDQDSWLRGQPGLAGDSPLVFDQIGQTKPAYDALASGLRAVR